MLARSHWPIDLLIMYNTARSRALNSWLSLVVKTA